METTSFCKTGQSQHTGRNSMKEKLTSDCQVRESIDVITEGYMASDAEDQEDEDDAPMPLTDAGEELLEERQRLMPY